MSKGKAGFGPSEDDIKQKIIAEIVKEKVEESPADSSYRVFSTEDDTVSSINKRCGHYKESNFNDGSMAKYEEQKAELQSTVNVMRNKIRRSLLALDRRDWDKSKEQGRIDSTRLVAAFNGSKFVHKTRMDRAEINTAVSILVDMSGSMSGGKMDMAAKVAIALSECFEGTGIVWSVTGWSNGGKQPKAREYEGAGTFHRASALHMVKFKDFDERLPVAKAALSVLGDMAGGDNSDYDAIQWQYNQLKLRREAKKVILVLSDGRPANAVISQEGGTNPYHQLVSHTKNLVNQIEKTGIQCIGIGIYDDTVKRIYKNNTVVNNLSDLAGEAFKKLNQILLDGKVRL
jgi:cobalamin biosynthesis protein CobT